MIFVSSWDDGHPLDEKVAFLLEKYGLTGTFFVPIRNAEGLPVLSDQALRRIAANHEIGSHTKDHLYLDSISMDEVEIQIRDGKSLLEQALGTPVKGFCYPGGKYNIEIARMVKNEGFAYARTTENLRLNFSNKHFLIPTTLQFYPHNRAVLLRNWVKYSQRASKLSLLSRLLAAENFEQQLVTVANYAYEQGGVLHMWGHSWEIDSHDLWGALEGFFRFVSTLGPQAKPICHLL